MIRSAGGWLVPIFLFAWAGAWIYFGVDALVTREFGFSWTRHSEHLLVRPDTYPYHFWGFVSLAFVLAAAGVGAGIVQVRRLLRECE